MEKENSDMKKTDGALPGFALASTPRIFWNSRKRSASRRNLDITEDTANETPAKDKEASKTEKDPELIPDPMLSERRKALFEPLDPAHSRQSAAETLLPPPDFDATCYPKGWLIGKKRKLVNVDVVESMRRVAVQEMNRKDREINGLNEQLEEDARCLEHLQLQLLEERSKRAEIERENAMLQDQVNMLMNMLQENEAMDDEGTEEP
ncbi:protein HEADING DATE REPRESSOR 1-like [Mangifera indica]|uniref:protein HEADING DATE REPRESSOR 1-like n=1 Tax=Mangifera indica TaxID=29780 RepID=UPI001CFACEBF|nr:protein HEADING DATE REPRESSOR 1-like [Mangifera indica]